MKAIGVDFDGVIHAYSRGWGDGSIYDEPLPGALEALRSLMEHRAVFIFTSRSKEQVGEWLRSRGFSVTTDDSMFDHDNWDGSLWDTMGVLLVTNKKLGAEVYIDDRAIRFTDWFWAMSDLTRITGTDFLTGWVTACVEAKHR